MLINKSLMLFRHAKSDWHADYHTDHERPLAARGIKAAKTMGRLLSSSGQIPDMIYCSTATRAKQTFQLANESGQWQCEVNYTEHLYEITADNTIRLLQQIPDTINSVMLVGHEPTWSSLTSLLLGRANIRFPTAAMTRIDFYVNSWSNLSVGHGQLRWFLQPKFFT